MKKIILMIILILIFTTGCTTIQNIFKRDSGIQLIELHTGRKGITMNFLDNAPPDSVYASDEIGEEAPFPAGFRIRNVGAHTIENGFIALSLEKDYMKLVKWNTEGTNFVPEGASGDIVRFFLEGKTQLDPLGKEEVVTFMLNSFISDPQSERHTSAILLTACYDYETEVGVETCIDTDVYNLRPLEKVCTSKPLSFSRGQGGPVAVTQIIPKMTPVGDDFVKPMFLIYVENLDNGLVVKQDKIRDACTSIGLREKELKQVYNMVDLEEISFSDYSFSKGDIECEPKSLQLRENKGMIRCNLKRNLLVRETPTYQTNLYIKLKYGYTQTTSKNIQIERILTY